MSFSLRMDQPMSFNRRRRPVILLGLALLALAGAGRALPPAQAQAPGPDGMLKIPAPELPEKLKWLNSPPLTMSALRGKVVLIDFWEYTCVNCIRTLPYLKAWNDKYKDKGLVIVGVHTPEFKFAREEPNVAHAIKSFNLTYPIILDSDYAVWNTYGNRFWPAKYLIDAQGYVRYFHFGEGGYEATEAKIQSLLREANPRVELPAITRPIRGTDRPGAVCYPVTPELYVGYERGAHEETFGNPEGYHPEKSFTYKDPGRMEDGRIYLQGAWRSSPEAMISTRASTTPRDYLRIRYHALEVNAVIKPEEGKPIRVWVTHDGRPVTRADAGTDIRWDDDGQSFITVDRPRMYSLVHNARYGQRQLKLAPAESGLGIYSFTFVSCEAGKR